MREQHLSVKARPVAEKLVADWSGACHQIEIGGSLRREAREVGDIEIVACPKSNSTLFDDEQGQDGKHSGTITRFEAPTLDRRAAPVRCQPAEAGVCGKRPRQPQGGNHCMPISCGNRSRGTVPIFAAEGVLVVGNRLSPRKWDCPLRPVRGQVHLFGFRLFHESSLLAEKWTSPPPARERLPLVQTRNLHAPAGPNPGAPGKPGTPV